MAEPKSRREAIKNTPRTYRKLSQDPIEIPATRKTIPDTRAMVRQYVHQALEQAGAKEGYDTVDAMLDEELDLDPEDPDPPWTSQYEVSEMDEVQGPLEEAPPQEGDPPTEAEEEKAAE